jgi:excisionase family DNA binding protein
MLLNGLQNGGKEVYTTGCMNEILTVQEAASFLKKHPGTIRRWIISKKLKARKIPAGGTGVFVILKTDLLEFSIAKMVRAERKEKREAKKVTPPSGQETLPI